MNKNIETHLLGGCTFIPAQHNCNMNKQLVSTLLSAAEVR